ncbi:hypothetical protein SO694_00025017 [Aureococcus anophagefferens]|uniref:Uncharacterized protein n=1 Tax=Aureococcus anophagefferens TaxID=44056 RepID=A0ABR1FV04_AURAN
MLAVGSARAALEYLREALLAYAALGRDGAAPPAGAFGGSRDGDAAVRIPSTGSGRAKTHDALAMRLAGFNDVDDRGVRGPGRSAGLLPVLGAAATEGLLYDLAGAAAAPRGGSRRSLF